MNRSRSTAQIADNKGDVKDLGFALIPLLFDEDEIQSALDSIESAMDARDNPSVLTAGRGVYAARNLSAWWPQFSQWAFHPKLTAVLEAHLKRSFGLVRAIYFDKNPDSPWGLPWHQDLNIAVADNASTSSIFTNPTRKKGVPHVEAPESLLANMLTARIHLDDAHAGNGALEVLPGSHLSGKRGMDSKCEGTEGVLLECHAGDVLLMRPLLYHRSSKPAHDNRDHRRVLHFEYAPSQALPENFQWHEFLTGIGPNPGPN